MSLLLLSPHCAGTCVSVVIVALCLSFSPLYGNETLKLDFEHSKEGDSAIAIFRIHIDTKEARIIWLQKDASGETDGFCRFEELIEEHGKTTPNRSVPFHPEWRPLIANGRGMFIASNISSIAAELSDGLHDVRFALQLFSVAADGKAFRKAEKLISGVFQLETKDGLLVRVVRKGKGKISAFEHPIGGFMK